MPTTCPRPSIAEARRSRRSSSSRRRPARTVSWRPDPKPARSTPSSRYAGPSPATGDGSGTSVNRRSRNGAAVSDTTVRSGSARRTRPSRASQARRFPSRSSRMSRPACPTRSWVTWMPSRTVIHGGSARRRRSTALRIATAACAARSVASSTGSRPKLATIPVAAEVLDPAAEAARLLDERLDETTRVQAIVAGWRTVDRRAQEGHTPGLPADGRGRRIRDHRRRGWRRGTGSTAGSGPGAARDPPGRSRCLAIR